MEKYIDFHFHSVHSEGDYTVEQLLKMAKEHHIAAMALTDHNVIAGVPAFLKLSKKYGIKAYSGIELYTRHQDQNLHLLGYNFDVENTKFKAEIKKLQADNLKNIKKSIQQLKNQGFQFDAERIFNLPASNYGSVHLLKEIEKHSENIRKMDQELAPDQNNFFGKISKYMGRSSPAYLPVSWLPTTQAIKLIKNAGGLAILAHPGQMLNYDGDKLILDLVKNDLDGLEVLSPYHTWHQIEHYQELTLKHNLIITGGSDFHGDIDFTKNEPIERQWDYFKIPYRIYENLKKHL